MDKNIHVNQNLLNEINIDTSIWANPFNSGFTNIESILLYEKYLSQNNELLREMSNLVGKKLITKHDPSIEWTHGEVIMKYMAALGFFKNLCVVNRDIFANQCGIIVHQVNCRGVMGSGIALEIRKRFKNVFLEYQKQKLHPGDIQIVPVKSTFPKLFICNLAGQDDFGRHKTFTDYTAVAEGFKKLQKLVPVLGDPLPIFIPYKMGCGHAGGDWEKYSKIIYDIIPLSIVCQKKEIINV